MLAKTFTPFLVLTVIFAAGCKQELPKQLEATPVFGTIQEVQTLDGEKKLLYQQGEDPAAKHWGLASSYYVTVEGNKYQVTWEHADKFKTLKAGDKVNLHPTEYIACVGENEIKPTCYRLMKIFKNERRVDPIQLNN